MLDVLSGKIDMQERQINVLPNKPTLAQNRRRAITT